MQLYNFFNSSTSYRVRIALALKGLAYDYLAINLRTDEQRAPDYLSVSPAGIVPVLIDGEIRLTQSLAIIDYLDRTYPEPLLLPTQASRRLGVLEIANTVACDIHPINNLRVLKFLSTEWQIDAAEKKRWYGHWVDEGLAAVEVLLGKHGSGVFCIGDRVSAADCCLIPQIANAIRMDCNMLPYPRAMAVYAHCVTQDAFRMAAPQEQPDYLPS